MFFFSLKQTSLGDQKYFIATQGPTLSSFPNFWKMIWHQNCELLIMLCNFKEKNNNVSIHLSQLQCDHYFPCQANDDVKFEYPTGDDSEKDIKVSFISENVEENSGLIYRKLLIQVSTFLNFRKEMTTFGKVES